MDTTIDRTATTEPSGLARHLAGGRYMSLITFRKSGEAVPTPVWFALVGDRVYVVTERSAGKAQRIRNNNRVRVAPSDWRGRPRGDEIDATASIITDPSERTVAERALRERYGWQWNLFAWLGERRRGRNGTPDGVAFLAITDH